MPSGRIELEKQVQLRGAAELENQQLRSENEHLKQLLHWQQQESLACQRVFEQRVEEMRSSISTEFGQKLQSATAAYTDVLDTTNENLAKEHEKGKQKWKVKQSRYSGWAAEREPC